MIDIFCQNNRSDRNLDPLLIILLEFNDILIITSIKISQNYT